MTEFQANIWTQSTSILYVSCAIDGLVELSHIKKLWIFEILFYSPKNDSGIRHALSTMNLILSKAYISMLLLCSEDCKNLLENDVENMSCTF